MKKLLLLSSTIFLTNIFVKCSLQDKIDSNLNQIHTVKMDVQSGKLFKKPTCVCQ